MGCRILYDKDNERAAFFCSTTEQAFGPIFHDEGGGADAEAEAFARWVQGDPRRFTESELQGKYGEWLDAREAFLAAEREDELDEKLTDQTVDAFLSTQTDSDRERTDRIRAKFEARMSARPKPR